MKIPLPDKLDTIEVQPEFLIDSSAWKWYWMEKDAQYFNIVHMIKISNGAFSFTVKDTMNQDSLDREIYLQLTEVRKCVDTMGLKYLREYKYDVKLGSVLINCLIRNQF